MVSDLGLSLDMDVTMELEQDLEELASVFQDQGNDPRRLKFSVAKFFLRKY